MLKVGLTGGIASGKSVVACRLAAHGALVVDADVLAREVVAVGTEGLRQVVAEFGTEVLQPDGGLDRAKLGSLVFADPEARARLNAIVHPLVGDRAKELMAAAPADAVVVYDVPLLVENGLQGSYDVVVVVDADTDAAVARMVRDRGMTEADARARVDAQASRTQRRAVADIVVPNTGSLDQLVEEADALWRDLLTRADFSAPDL